MNVYALGTNFKSATDNKVIITIELCNQTDMSGIDHFHGTSVHSPFYRQLKINCGKVIKITDLLDETSFSLATVTWNQLDIAELQLNKYFVVEHHDNDKKCIIAYQYKISVIEQAGYVGKKYNGVSYKHYPSGLIAMKKYHKNGQLHSCSCYRDDMYNTLQGVRIYNNGRMDCDLTYSEREVLLQQTWYDSKGRVYSDAKAPVGRSQTSLPIKGRQKVTVISTQSMLHGSDIGLDVSSLPDSLSPDDESGSTSGDDNDDSNGNCGDCGGHTRIKPKRTETDSESET
jgi:hypothetical protein